MREIRTSGSMSGDGKRDHDAPGVQSTRARPRLYPQIRQSRDWPEPGNHRPGGGGSARALKAANFSPEMAPLGGWRPSKCPFFGFSLIRETLSLSPPQDLVWWRILDSGIPCSPASPPDASKETKTLFLLRFRFCLERRVLSSARRPLEGRGDYR